MAQYYLQVVNTSLLGEAPHWDEATQKLIYVDITNQFVYRYDPVTGERNQVKIDAGPVGFVVPVAGEVSKYVIGTGRDFAVMEWDGSSTTPQSLEVLDSVEAGKPNNRINDGKCDKNGRLWAGTIGEGDTPFDAALYKLDNNGDLTEVFGNVGTSNGMAWSSDNTLMYYNDTATGKVDVFDFNATAGTISNHRTVYDLWAVGEGGSPSPDGMTIDATGNLWVGCWGGWKAIKIDPNVGTKISQIDFPTANVTSLAFGGPNLSTLYVTTASKSLSDADLRTQPTAGSLFQVTDVGAVGQSAGIGYSGPVVPK